MGVAVGTMALVVVLSVFNGFEDLIKSLFNSFDPDIKITIKEGKTFTADNEYFNKIKNLDGLAFYTEVVEENTLLKYGDRYHPAIIKGVSDNFVMMTGIDSMLVEGKFILEQKDINYAVIGQGVAFFLGVRLNFVEPIQIYIPKRTKNVSLNPENAISRKYVFPSGIFSIQQDFDSKFIIVPINLARELLNYTNEVSAVEIKIKEPENVDILQSQIKQILGNDFNVKNRYEQHELLYKVMKSEKWAIYLILTFILIIAAFNIIGSLTMLIIDKQEDMEILKSMGANFNTIRKIFLLEGWMISFIGAIVGIIIGVIICWIQKEFGLVPLDTSGSFIISDYPVEMKVFDFVLVFITVVGIGFIAAWYPVRYITRKFVQLY